MKYFTVLSILFSLNANALPVLRESAGSVEDGYVTLYPDHNDPNLFYFLPNQMNFATDKTSGLPSFSLSTYGVEQADLTNSFGYMTFVFRPAMSDDIKNQISIFLAKNPKARIAPLPVGESYLTVGESRKGIPSTAMRKMFEQWELPPYGGLLETEVGGNAMLTGIGAKMMVNAIKTPSLTTLNSCYTIDGLTPVMHGKITINYSKVYEHFKAMAKVGWWIFGADVAREVEKLKEEGSIKIEVIGDTKFEDVVMEMARQLAKEYLTPSLVPHESEVRLSGSPFRLARFAFGSVSSEERKDVTFELKKQAAITDVRCIAAPFRGISPYANQLIVNTPI